MIRRLRRWPWLVGLTVTWVALQGDVSAGNALGGLGVSALVLVAVPMADAPRAHRVHPWALVRFVAFVTWSLVTSSVAVVMASLWPTDERLRAGIVRCELPGATPLVTTMVADAVTLTPGTLTVAADATSDPAVLHVHALGLGDVDGFRAEIADLHRRATAAMTPLGPDPVDPGGVR